MAKQANARSDGLSLPPRSPLTMVVASKPSPRHAAVTLAEREPLGQIVLRGKQEESGFLSSVAGVLGFGLPGRANTVTGDAARRAIWMGPKEWLIVGRLEDGAELARELEGRLQGNHAAVVDVSHSRVAFHLSGPMAREVLHKGCAIDLHPREFSPGRCVQTRLARCHMLMHQLDDAPSYDIYIHRSFARYAWAWLLDAGEEFEISADQYD